jgi:hypothetical protein
MNARKLQGNTVQHGSMAGAMSQNDWTVPGNHIQVMFRRVAFFGQKKLVIPVSTQPVSMWKRGKPASQKRLQFRKRASGAGVDTAKTARPGEEVQVRINEPRQDSVSTTIQGLGTGGDKRAEFVIRADRENPSCGNCNCFGFWSGRVESENASTV